MPIKSWLALLDDAGASSGSFDPLPDGDYNFRITHAEARQTSQGKTIYIVKASVDSGPFAGRIVWHEFVLQPSNPIALTQLFRSFEVIGLPISFFKSDPSDHHVSQELTDKTFRGQVIVKSTRGQERNEIVQFFNSTGGGRLKSAAATPIAASDDLRPQAAPAYSAPAPASVPEPVDGINENGEVRAFTGAAKQPIDPPTADDDDVAISSGPAPTAEES